MMPITIYLYASYAYQIMLLVILLLAGLTHVNKPGNAEKIKYLTVYGYIILIGIKTFPTTSTETSKLITFMLGALIVYLIFLKAPRKYEFYLFVIFAIFGMTLMIDSKDLATIFLCLELQAFVYYTMIGLKKKSLIASEGSLKYFLIGNLASAIFILGTSYIYGHFGSTNLDVIKLLHNPFDQPSVLTLGITLVIIALLFKIGAVPFHLWLPDAYQGATYGVLMFMTVFTKMFLFYLLFTIHKILPATMPILLAIYLTAVIGAIQVINQSNIKRFFAYTIIFNNCFFLCLVLASGYYNLLSLIWTLALYIVATALILYIFSIIRRIKRNHSIKSLTDLLMLKKSNFTISLCLTTALFSAIGVPPFIGFFQKFLTFTSLLEDNQFDLALILVVCSIAPVYFYLRLIKTMFFPAKAKWSSLETPKISSGIVIGILTSLTIYFALSPISFEALFI